MNNQVFNSKAIEIEIEAFHPGEFLMEEIVSRKIQKKQFAIKIGILPTDLSLLFLGMKDISAPLALKIGKELGTSSAFWLNMQSAFDLQKKLIHRV